MQGFDPAGRPRDCDPLLTTNYYVNSPERRDRLVRQQLAERPLFAHCRRHGVGHERPLSRQRRASTPIGFDPIVQAVGREAGLGLARGRTRAEMLRLDNRLLLERDKA